MPLKKEGRTGRPARPFFCARIDFSWPDWLRPLEYAILTKFVCGVKNPVCEEECE